jgi:type IV pilus assembly protein PilV
MSPRPERRAATGRRQRGSFLLEALVAILIVAFGILGLLGLESRALAHVDDAQYRSEAVAFVNSYIGQMWVSDQTTLSANFADTAGVGSPYDEFKKVVQARLPGAAAFNPTVTVTPAVAPAVGTDVTITVFWLQPADAVEYAKTKNTSNVKAHQYIATATINATN